ncbi:hypothetical protein [Georgenia satyanarayanai]|uniref:hypothetical protein n=1 Tax=Georgenia satyanarayanai TaxID=860221 RepID=UPI001264A17D|nr:hypothetical protein [Georgenia satyanarayanai]
MTAPAEDHDGASLIAILDELSALVTEARQMPMSASVLVNRAEALDLIAAAKAVVPGEIKAADDVLTGAEDVLADARERAARILREAEEQAERLVGQESVVELARQRSEQIITAAEERAAQLARDANDYCDRQLAQFEIDLGAITKQVRAGRDRLATQDPTPEP